MLKNWPHFAHEILRNYLTVKSLIFLICNLAVIIGNISYNYCDELVIKIY